MKKLSLSVIVVVAAMSMAACSKKTPIDNTDMMGGGGVDGSQAYGMSAQGGFSDQGGSGGAYQRHINAMTAPANQVYYFDFDQASIQQSDLQAMNIQANYIANHPSAHIRLEGNTDNRGSREYNVGLGWRRAQAVAQILEQQGVSPQQISMVSYGKEHPVAVGDNEQAWSLNRRVELIYENK